MKLLLPANFKELSSRAFWFKKPVARRLAAKHKIEFGFELKGELKDIKKAPPLFWGVHLPEMFSTEWHYHPEKRLDLLEEISKLSLFSPDYVVLHGVHLLWQPPAKEYVHRYINHSSPPEFFKILNSQIELIRHLKPYVNVKIENYALNSFYQDGEHYLPHTYLLTGVGRLSDLAYIVERTEIGIVFDIEHMVLTLNFLNREANYKTIPMEKFDELNPAEEEIKRIFGFALKKNFIPYLEKKKTLKEMIGLLKPKYFHINGAKQDVTDGKITTHLPVKAKDKIFRKNLKYALACKPEVMVLETADSTVASCYNYLRPNELEFSFETLCKILLEEL